MIGGRIVHGKRPTRKQKILIASYRLNPANWLVLGEDKEAVELMHRHTGHLRVIRKVSA